MTEEQKISIKNSNDKIIESKNYKFNSWLPLLEDPQVRSINEIKARISIMNTLINISFEAPITIIKKWIENNNLTRFLSNWENEILLKDNEELTDIEVNSLRWYLESLWAVMWATNLTDSLDETQWCGDNMVSLLPNLEKGENNQKIELISEIKPDEEIYTMLDYYYRLHWYCVDERINDREAKINERIVYERRKSLEWLMDNSSDWDDIEMST